MRTPQTRSPARIFGRPTNEQIWLGPAQRRAIVFLRAAVVGKTKLLLGPANSGKSVLLDLQLRDTKNTIFFRSQGACDSAAALLNALLKGAGVASMESSEVAQRNLLASYLEVQRSLGLDITIAIDDAERLTPNVWRELYRLRQIRFKDGYWLDFLLVGRPETYSRMHSTAANGWWSADVAVHCLPAPTPQDVSAYILHRLESAGVPKNVFSPSACELIATLSGGSFVWVNILCQWTLLLARERSIYRVDRELVKLARTGILAGPALRGEPRRPEVGQFQETDSRH